MNPMVVLSSVNLEHGELCAVMGGMTMIPELCVENLDMILKVVAVKVLSQVTDYKHVLCIDAMATQLFGGRKGLAFLSEVQCMGSEKNLTECHYTEARNHRCLSAGVTCGKSTSESKVDCD